MERKKGSVSVFFSLSFLLIFSLLLVMLEAARSSSLRAFAEIKLQSAVESLMSDYYRPLFDKYHVFGLDMGFGESKSSTAEAEARLMASIGEEGNGLSCAGVAVAQTEPFLDAGGKEFLKQAVEYQKYGCAESLLSELLERFKLISGQTKLSKLLQRRIAIEEKLALIDRNLLELMELIDGVDIGSGLFSSKKTYKIKDRFVKQLMILPVSQENVGINNPTLFAGLRPQYINPVRKTQELVNYALSYRSTLESMESLLKVMANCQSAEALAGLAQAYASLSTMASAMRESMNGICPQLKGLCENCLEKARKALGILDLIELNQTAARPLIEGYEQLIDTIDFVISEDTSRDLRRSLSNMKTYAGMDNNGSVIDFDLVRSTLEKDIALLEACQADMLYRLPAQSPDAVKAWIVQLEATVKLYEGFSYEGLVFDYSGYRESAGFKEIILGIKELAAEGFLGYILPEGSEISERELLSELLPSMTLELLEDSDEDGILDMLLGGIDESNSTEAIDEGTELSGLGIISTVVEQIADGISSDFLRAAYVQEHFKNYSSTANKGDTVLQYEQEYILCGDKADSVNLSRVILRLFLLRFAIVLIYAMTNETVRTEAAAIAATLSGFTGLPFLASLVKYLIIVLWAAEQAVVETGAIMRGKKVAIIPSSSSFCISAEELLLFTPALARDKAESFTPSAAYLSYDNYLLLMLLIEGDEKLAGYSMDLIQENLRYAYDEDFLLYNCAVSLTAEAAFYIPAKFTAAYPGFYGDYDYKGIVVNCKDSWGYLVRE